MAFGPNRQWPYFDVPVTHGTPIYRGRYLISSTNWGTITCLAEMSLLAYVPEPDFVATALARLGYEHVPFAADGAAGFVARRGREAVVAFRGTETWDLRDIRADLDLKLASWAHSGRVHRGFLHSYIAALPAIRAALRDADEADTWYTGHSLGGALATLTAVARGDTGRLVTFGAPRVGDHVFARLAVSRGVPVRVVHNNDLVPRIPVRPYKHAGRLAYLDRRGLGRFDPPRLLRWRDRLLGYIEHQRYRPSTAAPLDSIADHNPTRYVEACLATARALGLTP